MEIIPYPLRNSDLKPVAIDACTQSNRDKARSLIDRLGGRLENLHLNGAYVEAACPKCGGKDRFFAGPKVNYSLFHCRQCDHSVKVTELLGLAWQVQHNPAVKPWTQTVDDHRIDECRRVYASLADFAASHLSNPVADAYLNTRGFIEGVTPELSQHRRLITLRRAGLGYINTALYREWYAGLDAGDRAACEWAGLPDGSRQRFAGHAAMFAGGYSGKITFAYRDDAGAVVDIRTRSISDNDTVGGRKVRYTSPKGSADIRGATVPFGLQLPQSDRVIITEGEFKALTPALLAGVGTLSLRGIDDWQPGYAEYLRGRLIILAFDNDAGDDSELSAGQKATVRYGRLLTALGIDTMVLPPSALGTSKGIDDFISDAGPAAFIELLQPANLLPVSVFEYQLTKVGYDLSAIRTPRADIGTVRQWMPATAVDRVAITDAPAVSVDAAVTEIRTAVRDHIYGYFRTNPQLLIAAPAGVGKTTVALEEALTIADEEEQTVAILLPNHDTIDEKIVDGTLAGFKHIYGHNEENCTQYDRANALTAKGYSPGLVLCPDCPMAQWCAAEGYKSQFVGKSHRAYVHQHAFTDYPSGEDIVIADEFTQSSFVGTMRVSALDIAATLASDVLTPAQRWLLDGINRLFQAPGLGDIDGAVFYEALEGVYPQLRNVDQWGNSGALQMALDGLAKEDVAPESLPQQFGRLLIDLLAEDVALRNRGERVTGRVRLVSAGAVRWLELTYRRSLAGWINVRPTIVLNATADAGIMRDLLGELKVVAPNVAIADGNSIVQDVTYNNAKSAYLGSSADSERRRSAWLDVIRTHIAGHHGGEADTTIIVAKALVGHVQKAFPLARVGHYHAVEGRNDLQSGLTILASAVPVNMPAIQREAAALWPGIDTTLTRSSIAFDYANAESELLAVEQVDGLDPLLSALIGQHRDAAAVQALHRSRIIRQSGRKVVVMFARPIPGLKPDVIITDRPTVESRRAKGQVDLMERLRAALVELVEDAGGAAADLLAAGAGCAVNTARKYLPDLCAQLHLNRITLPVLQPLANGGVRKREVELVLTSDVVGKIKDATKMHVNHDAYNIDQISAVIYVHLGYFFPKSWSIDVETLLATLLPPASDHREQSGQKGLSGRWRAVLDAKRLKQALLSQGEEARHHARVVVDYMNGRRDDRQTAYSAADLLGVRMTIDWRALREV